MSFQLAEKQSNASQKAKSKSPPPVPVPVNLTTVDEETSSNLRAVEAKAKEIQKMIDSSQQQLGILSKSLRLLGTRQDTQKLRSKLHTILEQTRNDTLTIQRLLLSLVAIPDGPENSADRERRKILERKLAKDFATLREDFAKLCASVQKQLNAKLSRDDHRTNNEHTEDETGSLLGEEVRTERLQLENELTFNHAVIQERHQQVAQIHQNMGEVREMFNDLATMVSDQGVLIDVLDRHITSTRDKTADAHQQLKKAVQHQKSSRTKMCCLAFLFALATLGGLMLWYSMRAG